MSVWGCIIISFHHFTDNISLTSKFVNQFSNYIPFFNTLVGVYISSAKKIHQSVLWLYPFRVKNDHWLFSWWLHGYLIMRYVKLWLHAKSRLWAYQWHQMGLKASLVIFRFWALISESHYVMMIMTKLRITLCFCSRRFLTSSNLFLKK